MLDDHFYHFIIYGVIDFDIKYFLMPIWLFVSRIPIIMISGLLFYLGLIAESNPAKNLSQLN